MATKSQVMAYLNKIAPGSRLELDEGPCDIQAQIEAPSGHHWSEGVHCLAMPPWYSGSRSEYWDLVLGILKDLSPKPVKCVDDDCEGITMFGVCEYWEDE